MECMRARVNLSMLTCSLECEPWAAAQVGFKDQKQVQKFPAVKRVNDVVNRLNRSRRESFPDLAAEREMYEKEVSSGAYADYRAGPERQGLCSGSLACCLMSGCLPCCLCECVSPLCRCL